ncbi:CPBP family intramembrane glutamic endopeptidase [Oceanirhabdus sp. W0125-5]|uniref:CPBP family intramembrane glutamic endopeptidase n=1 Tax=Oceanirhabdus sp. W0125-5 TaxID=2999116 RepID=UPI0022F33122|nr:type II CAAX endopeptidase family protein [Oceanirhabdus sp. W0125-5]WBW96755.1 type II CAAX endopeptidase family protein [Oceanirhabdus sp. W0125-5]
MMLIGSLFGVIGDFVQLPDYLKTSIFTLTIGFGSSTLLCFLYVKKIEKRPISSIGFIKDFAFKKYLLGFLIGSVFMSLCVLVATLLGGFEINTMQTSNTGIKTLLPILCMLIGFIIQGGTEEVLSRGWVLPVVGAKYNVPFGIVVSTVFFTLLHGMNPGMKLMPIINLILFSIFAALYVIQTKELWGICGFHSAWNWFQGNIFGIKVSGNRMTGGSLFSFDSVENLDLISGGNFGIEGSLICSFIYLMGIVYLSYKITKNMKCNIKK